MMNTIRSSRTRALVAPVIALVGLGGVAIGYGALHATAGTRTAGTRTAPTASRGRAAAATTSGHVTPAAVTGSWVYRDALTYELLRLKVNNKGVISGDGMSTDKSATNPRQTGQYTISVHDGRLRGNVLTASLYVQQQFGLYYTAIENVRCTTAVSVLHCHTHTQIAQKVFDSAQNFYRH